ncbi:heavy metal translocating P-type ATPase, partial [Patescibacteria group bacterium]|nr:heavy metal translocating P-type ATPase [Patescibacteria group bacterium]
MTVQKKYIALAAAAIIIADLLFLKYKFAYADLVLAGAILLASLPLIYELIQSALKLHFGVDLIAIVAIVFSLFVGQYLAGAVILLMLSGGETLEQYALKRARKELTNLISNAPSVAHKKADGSTEDIDVDQVKVGDLLLVKPNEVVPVDCLVKEGQSMVDQSAITGESEPVEASPGKHIFSGSINKEHPLTVEAVNTSGASKYQRIVALVREAEQNKAPIVRLADRYTLFFTIVTFGLALASWLVAKDPQRLLAVLVVATPCPLILATPIAIISGISRVSNAGVIAKNGGALEKLGEVKAFIFDKTGTLTIGTPRVAEVRTYGIGREQALQIAASLDQYSTHIFADALTDYVRKNKITPLAISGFKEETGKGVNAELAGKKYYLGKLAYLREKGVSIKTETEQQHAKNQEQGLTEIFLADTLNLLAGITFADEIRPET